MAKILTIHQIGKTIIILFVSMVINITYGQDKNYIHTVVYKQPYLESNLSNANTNDKIESITYYDALGRSEQTIAIRAGGQEQDVISFKNYDAYGRENKIYLPFAKSANNGSYENNPLNSVNSFYNTAKYENTTNPYSEVLFEASPMGRALKQGSAGTDWKLNTTSDSDHTTKFKYQINEANEVKQFDVSHPNSDLEKTELEYIGNYPLGELYKSVVKNENWQPTQTHIKDNTIEEFTNKIGRLVLKRTYNDNQPHDTYYVHDDFGNLTYVIPPLAADQDISGTTQTDITSNAIVSSGEVLNLEASNSITLMPGFNAKLGSTFSARIVSPNVSNQTDILDNLCYIYHYNKRNQIVEMKIPGKEWEYVVYDKLDRPILTQDALQRDENVWLFTKFNKFGKVVYTGKYSYTPIGTNSNSGRLELQNQVNNQSNPKWYEITGTSNVDGQNLPYTNQSFPTNSLTLHTIHYYDDYNMDTAGIGLTLPTTILGQQVSNKTKSLGTISKVRILDTYQWETTVSYYDKKGMPIYAAKKNEYLSTVDKSKIKYAFSGQIVEFENSHTKSSVTIVTNNKYTYDHAGRVLTQTQSINGGDPELLANNAYDELGRIENIKVGGAVATIPENSNGLQTIDYKYNIRGWLKQINNPTSLGDDLFSLKIGYNQGSNALYNGNISQTSWKTASINPTSNPVSNAYNYTYDALNRITSGIDNTNNYSLSGVSYDKNGNIQTLERKAIGGLMDNLTYTYDEGNKLKSVTDAIIGSLGNDGFKDGNTNGDDYTYDENGNMLKDLNKGINTDIIYNHLDLPKQVTLPNGTIQYFYDATGKKLKKIITEGSVVKTIEYAGKYIYENNVLKFFSHAEGYAEPDGSGGFDYVYQYKDHLGNIRLSYSDIDGNGSVANSEIVEENNYYPFGLKHKGYNSIVSANTNDVANKFKFNGKEQEKALGYNMYEMDVRSLDPALGRWTSMDPVTHHSMSTYNAFDNNPVLISDPSGADGMIGSNGGSGWTLYSGQMGTQSYGYGHGFGSIDSAAFNYAAQQPNSSEENVNDPNNSSSGSSVTDSEGSQGSGAISDAEWAKLTAGSMVLNEVTVIAGNKESYDAAILNIVGQIYATEWYDSNSFMENMLSTGMFVVNSGLGGVSTVITYKGKYHLSNEVFHINKTGKSLSNRWRWRWDKRYNNPVAKAWRITQLEKVKGIRNLSTKLTKAGGVLIIADIALSGEIKVSHGINGLATGLALTGFGAPIAAVWFIADLGTGTANYFLGNGFRTISDIIDDNTGSIELYDGLY
ncbi:DUF6443 domain-containing protein [Changchengzhania lutea]|uniref:DUF6443 domain-containing protein n=1 Tax=Changchengzhania lutea TaxID=2049305 RepID=UPI00115D3F02|nr:DUF6443 domain-containing protein [Changchengzhania lutea]